MDDCQDHFMNTEALGKGMTPVTFKAKEDKVLSKIRHHSAFFKIGASGYIVLANDNCMIAMNHTAVKTQLLIVQDYVSKI